MHGSTQGKAMEIRGDRERRQGGEGKLRQEETRTNKHDQRRQDKSRQEEARLERPGQEEARSEETRQDETRHDVDSTRGYKRRQD